MVYVMAGDKLFSAGDVVGVQRHPFEREPKYGVTVRMRGGHIFSFEGPAAEAVHKFYFGPDRSPPADIDDGDLVYVIDLMPEAAAALAGGGPNG